MLCSLGVRGVENMSRSSIISYGCSRAADGDPAVAQAVSADHDREARGRCDVQENHNCLCGERGPAEAMLAGQGAAAGH